MSHSLIATGEGNTMSSKLRNLVQAQKPEIKIKLNNAKKAYSTLDEIEGVVSVTVPVDTPFDAVDIEFIGTSRAYVERLTTAAAVSGRSEAFHQFLKLTQPGLQEHYPADGILKAGQTYGFPFVFVVPQQLLPRVCQHKVKSPTIRDAHMQLPPTFGDKDLTDGTDALDDLAPEMASIRYGVFAKVSRVKSHGDESSRLSLASKARRLRVTPAVDEQPPLEVSGEDDGYVMRKEKSMRKGMLKGKLGTMVMEAAQPQSFRLAMSSNPECRTTTMATVMLRFDPAEEGFQPPKLGSLSSKLKVTTFFASTARQQFPSKTASLVDVSQGLHTEQINLSSRCMANVEWTKCDAAKSAPMVRRDSACSTLDSGEVPDASASYKGKTYYTARLLVPITLPNNKAFVPTFHSCLISRIYQLKMELNTSGIGMSIDLKVPVQISSEHSTVEASPRRESTADSSDETEVDFEDASDFFEPRTMRAPSEGFVGRSRMGSQAPMNDAPPGYSPYVPAGQRRRTSVPAY